LKLLTKTSLYYLLISILVYTVSVVIFYFVIQDTLYEEVEKDLWIERRKTEDYIKKNNALPVHRLTESNFRIEPVPEFQVIRRKKPKFNDTLIYNKYRKEKIPYKQINFYTEVQGKNYKVSIRESLVDSEDLIEGITFMFIIILLLLLFFLFFFNQWISKKLWKTFYDSLSRAKSFDLTQPAQLNLLPDKISEFNELNQTLNKMTSRMREDYENLKQFTENASHEIQTPLSVVSNNVELLIQTEDINTNSMELIKEIYQATNKISKLHQALLLLSKIENRQFPEVIKINLHSIIENKLDSFDEMLSFKNITVEKKISGSFSVVMNPVLADILIGNLLNNAIKHNYPGGKIIIEETNDHIVFLNTGEALRTPPDQLFERFRKENQASDSLGLGLSIVKQICDNNNLTIFYSSSNNFHGIHISPKIQDFSNM
jgi:signal transduction histidine kinase